MKGLSRERDHGFRLYSAQDLSKVLPNHWTTHLKLGTSPVGPPRCPHNTGSQEISPLVCKI